ncbi:hypothetical protein PVAP13_5NG515300 [Panicum virgatum]|uniref:Uncharacterized protein n=1 Tax=Panicum virgatum TaxID=38727 RepID=A0A8T0S169_PANVG|nr:hypothetical protein PVAP13_5NG515300 [Panicum virgatum]
MKLPSAARRPAGESFVDEQARSASTLDGARGRANRVGTVALLRRGSGRTALLFGHRAGTGALVRRRRSGRAAQLRRRRPCSSVPGGGSIRQRRKASSAAQQEAQAACRAGEGMQRAWRRGDSLLWVRHGGEGPRRPAWRSGDGSGTERRGRGDPRGVARGPAWSKGLRRPAWRSGDGSAAEQGAAAARCAQP